MSVDLAFFCDVEARPRPLDPGALPPGRPFSSVLRPVTERVPLRDHDAFVRQLRAILADNWRGRQPEAEFLRDAVSSALRHRAAAGPDAWSRAAALTTILTVTRATGLPCAGAEAWRPAGVPNLAQALAAALQELYHGEAQRVSAGPLGFLWVALAVSAYLAHAGDDAVPVTDPAVAEYLTALRRLADGPAPAPATTPVAEPADRVRAYLRERLEAPPGPEPDHVPARRLTWADALRFLFNGDCYRWTAGGVGRVAACAAALALAVAGAALWWQGEATVRAFTHAHVRPYEDALRGRPPAAAPR
jgi:hypothetical protein